MKTKEEIVKRIDWHYSVLSHMYDTEKNIINTADVERILEHINLLKWVIEDES